MNWAEYKNLNDFCEKNNMDRLAAIIFLQKEYEKLFDEYTKTCIEHGRKLEREERRVD
jgi:hypothetical protein